MELTAFKLGPGSVYLPSLPVTVPSRTLSRPASAKSLAADLEIVSRENSPRKPKLLNNVVFNYELDEIVNRLSRPTMSSRVKSARYRPQATFVSMDYYNWHRMPSFNEHLDIIYTPKGAVRNTFKRTTKRPYTSVGLPSYQQHYGIPIPKSVW